MATNEFKTLMCGAPAHGDMARLMGANAEDLGRWSMWVCEQCGLLALHLEANGDIFWYNAQSTTQTPSNIPWWQRQFPSVYPHNAECSSCGTRFDCNCPKPGYQHMCDPCYGAPEESKKTGELPTGDPGEAAQDRAQTRDS